MTFEYYPYEGIYRFAGVNTRILSRYYRVHELCEEYREDPMAPVVLTIMLSQREIDEERAITARQDIRQGPVRPFSDEELEAYAIYRKICMKLLHFDTVVLHGSVVSVDGEGFLFAAPSGGGKSTHTALYREVFGDKVTVINDDKPLVSVKESEGVTAYGTPWAGKEGLSVNLQVPLQAICILEKGEQNEIEKIDKTQALPFLLSSSYRPTNPDEFRKAVMLISLLCSAVPIYLMTCNMDPEAARLSYETMRDPARKKRYTKMIYGKK